jgi:hypothetical protein
MIVVTTVVVVVVVVVMIVMVAIMVIALVIAVIMVPPAIVLMLEFRMADFALVLLMAHLARLFFVAEVLVAPPLSFVVPMVARRVHLVVPAV